MRAKIAATAAVLLAAATVAGCGSGSKPSKSSDEQTDTSLSLQYPSPPVGDRAAFSAAYDACSTDALTPPLLCRCIAAKLSQRADAANLDYPTLLDYNNQNPPDFLVVIINIDCSRA